MKALFLLLDENKKLPILIKIENIDLLVRYKNLNNLSFLKKLKELLHYSQNFDFICKVDFFSFFYFSIENNKNYNELVNKLSLSNSQVIGLAFDELRIFSELCKKLSKNPDKVIFSFKKDEHEVCLCMIGYHPENGLMIRNVSDNFEAEAKNFFDYLNKFNKVEFISINGSVFSDFISQKNLKLSSFKVFLIKKLMKNIYRYKAKLLLLNSQRIIDLIFVPIVLLFLFLNCFVVSNLIKFNDSYFTETEKIKLRFKEVFKGSVDLIPVLKEISTKIPDGVFAKSIAFSSNNLRIHIFNENCEAKLLENLKNISRAKITDMNGKNLILEIEILPISH